MKGVKVFPFTSFQQLLDYVVGRKGILVAINAEKILHATHQTRDIINRNIGYCDGVGAVMALRKHGHKDVVKLPGCELWLKIIAALAPQGKRFYLVGSKPAVIEQTVMKLRADYPGINIVGYRDGYIKTDAHMRTSIPGVYAAGDLRVKSLRQVVTAAADGAIAAMQAEKYIANLK